MSNAARSDREMTSVESPLASVDDPLDDLLDGFDPSTSTPDMPRPSCRHRLRDRPHHDAAHGGSAPPRAAARSRLPTPEEPYGSGGDLLILHHLLSALARLLGGEIQPPPWVRRAAQALEYEFAAGDMSVSVEHLDLADDARGRLDRSDPHRTRVTMQHHTESHRTEGPMARRRRYVDPTLRKQLDDLEALARASAKRDVEIFKVPPTDPSVAGWLDNNDRNEETKP